MDREARQRAFKTTRREIRKVGASRLLPNWAEFVALLDTEIAAANARECEGLPKIVDEAAGRRRHMSPTEMWAKAIAEGWRPDPIPAEEARDLFRPVETRTAKRAIVELFGNEYYGGAALEALHGEAVQVAYDIHDASKVWVRDAEGRLICEAIWGGHKTAFAPVEKIRLDHEKRVAGMKKRAQVHVAQAEAELRAPLIEHQPAEALHFPTLVSEPVPVPVLTEVLPPVPAPARADGRPLFGDDVEKAKWLVGNPIQVSDGDREWLRQQLRSHHFLTLMEWEGIAATTLHNLAKNKSETKAA
jgi:putative transposase